MIFINNDYNIISITSILNIIDMNNIYYSMLNISFKFNIIPLITKKLIRVCTIQHLHNHNQKNAYSNGYTSAQA